MWLLLTPSSRLSSSSTKSSNNSKNNSREKFFVTRPAFFSVELNAHFLTYLIILVQQHQLPVEALNISLFSSQTCESLFRDTRSLSGAFSTVVNYTVDDFLRRSMKLSMLNAIKSQGSSTSLIKFPIHHKRLSENMSANNHILIDVSTLDVETIVLRAYQSALHLTEQLNISSVSCLSLLSPSFDRVYIIYGDLGAKRIKIEVMLIKKDMEDYGCST